MKNTFVSSFIAAILISVSNISYAALPATTGTVKFKGDIVESTCSVNSSSLNIVDMGTYLKSDIQKNKGVVVSASKKDFDITLTKCPVTSVPVMMDIVFSGNIDSHHEELLALDSSGETSATGIGIGIYNRTSGTLINWSSSPHLTDIKIDKTEIKIPLQVAYISNGEPIQAGKADSTLNFTINYK
ncbi:fimbrial protein [Xenorhabdus hominickii]|uniref:S-fimbrial protein subunit n=1 Tax=Xenorhabdus hominickii TaxID=351679 RepID=A0A2G0Q686_XENHO|nr:fimbrial protein [Xenorhabdus hominickii]AOM39516.1 hypothetical protein A9255_02220 [Xenorhabdus hominickii]PHM54713.1 S-fimbrial protein subunit precursor [Xenorhabdus hominickii]